MWGIKHIVSFEKMWSFFYDFHFSSISTLTNNFYKLTCHMGETRFFLDIFQSYLKSSLQVTFQHLCCRLGNGSGDKDGSCYCEA